MTGSSSKNAGRENNSKRNAEPFGGKMEEDHEAVNLAADWADISLGLRKALGQQLHSQWIKPIQVGMICKESGVLDLFLPNEFTANWVRERFADRLSLAWKIARPDLTNVRIEVLPGRRHVPELRFGQGGNACHAANDSVQVPGEANTVAIGSGEFGTFGQATITLDPSLTFTTFVTGTANTLAYNAAQRVAAIEPPQFSPLYLKAATGQGKTHLLHAIGHAYLASHPRGRIFYCSAERVMVEFVQALRANQMIEFKARLRGCDLLRVDDIQFIIGKE